MADVEEPRPMTLAERKAVLQLSHVRDNPRVQYPSTPRPRPPPPAPKPGLPMRPDLPNRVASANNPPLRDHATINGEGIGNHPAPPPINGASANGMDGISRPALPPKTSNGSSQGPPLPSRTPSMQVSPALPPRRPSATPSNGPRRPSEMQLTRRESQESISSIGTNFSAVSGRSNGTSVTSGSQYAIKAPEFDASKLPALPPKRTQEEKDAQALKDRQAAARKGSASSMLPNALRRDKGPSLPSRPAARPAAGRSGELSRVASNGAPATNGATDETRRLSNGTSPAPVPPPATRQIAAPPPKRSALEMGFGNTATKSPALPGARPGSTPATNGAPPPLPTASKPDLSALQASKPKSAASGPAPQMQDLPGACLHCRDFSAPDAHAARFPRESIPSTDIGWLANQLTSPFPSATDKARAIFTWLHHNVAYDVVAFFNDNVKPSTPASTLTSGLAVCEGYAGLFSTLAIKAGLECFVVSGASKGYGHSPLAPGQAIPAFKSTHAWNAVKIDGGVWKLIDPCWGAGHVQKEGPLYTKKFSPERFTQSNADFGTDHFPSDNTKQFREDGRVVSYEEYFRGQPNGTGCLVNKGTASEEGFAPNSFTPISNPIVPSTLPGPTVRFMFQKVCPHWDQVRHGKGAPYTYLLNCSALKDDKHKGYQAMNHKDGVWWLDVPVRDLGGPGEDVAIVALSEFCKRDGRGLRAEEWTNRHGKSLSCDFKGVANWKVG
nr:hypothetical protein B0A51_08076 [Rachicladosporium sp. CCFEE 5018]